jgi:hypothetical protein
VVNQAEDFDGYQSVGACLSVAVRSEGKAEDREHNLTINKAVKSKFESDKARNKAKAKN